MFYLLSLPNVSKCSNLAEMHEIKVISKKQTKYVIEFLDRNTVFEILTITGELQWFPLQTFHDISDWVISEI